MGHRSHRLHLTVIGRQLTVVLVVTGDPPNRSNPGREWHARSSAPTMWAITTTANPVRSNAGIGERLFISQHTSSELPARAARS
jgi:hypothetical protein